ncbi:WD40 repeat-like protein [Amylostereum chailletii]|nr:WD40 repeat-like protein [Amylostereum chailletii]
MRLPESDRDSNLSVSPDLPEAGPSSLSTGLKANGHAVNGGMNGHASRPTTNGLSKRPSIPLVELPGTLLYDDSNIDREEFVRLVLQTLRDVGYTGSAATLEAESGYEMEISQAADFRRYVLEGAWSDAERALEDLAGIEDASLWEAKHLLSQQKYLELLEAGKATLALHVLRNELAPFYADPETIQPLSSLVMCSDAVDLRQRAGWDGANGLSRQRLLERVQDFIPSSVMIPPRRFRTLLNQALHHQRSQCLHHNTSSTSGEFSLFDDHECNSDMFPRVTTTILEIHTDEVWNLEWSHNGKRLATASKDKSVIVWAIGTEPEPVITAELHLRDHLSPVGCLAWSLDDSILLSSSEHVIKMWNTKTGLCTRTIDSAHTDTVSALAWLPDGSGFVSGSQDRKIIIWGTDGKQRHAWSPTSIRITDLAVTPDFTRLVAVGESATSSSAHNYTPPARGDSITPPGPGSRGAPASVSGSGDYLMIVYDIATKEPAISIALEGQLTSVKISEDSQYALINHAPDEIHLWDLSTGQMARKYTGQRQGHHIIRSCFGGVDNNFVVSGSEDGNVYVWHRERGILLDILSGHGSGSVNSVAWNPRNKKMFASCSDDCTIRIWEALPAASSSSSRTADRTLFEPTETGKGKGKRREPWNGADGVERQR